MRAPAFLVLSLACANVATSAESPRALIETEIERIYPQIEGLYRHFHSNPELSKHEEKTGQRIAEELRKLDIQVADRIGGHGVVGVLRRGAGPTVLIRGDMDALPVKEQTGLPYASRVRTTNDDGVEVSVMHACGHDVHITCLVGVAHILTRLTNWNGTLVFLAQPAEEFGLGAKAMLDDGLFTRFPKPNYCVALHVNAELPIGTIGVTEGYSAANVDSVDITIRGVGGHGAYPHKTKDPVVLAAQTILALQTIISRERDPLEPAVVTVGSIHGGTKHNIIPDDVQLQLTVRSFTDEMRQQVLDTIKRVVRGQAVAAGIPEDRLPTVKVRDDFTPVVYNNPELVQRLAGVFRKLLGEDKVVKREPTMGGEDFGLFGRTEDKIPICMFSLGSVDPGRVEESQRTGKPLPSLHSSLYAPVAEPTIKLGLLTMTAAVLDLVGSK
jgi:amidohydrolase